LIGSRDNVSRLTNPEAWRANKNRVGKSNHHLLAIHFKLKAGNEYVCRYVALYSWIPAMMCTYDTGTCQVRDI
jgi:hypothetical protein